MAHMKWAEEAHGWLRDIFGYIAADNPTAAHKVVRGIHTKAQALRRLPEIGYRYRDVPEGEISGLR